MFGWAGQMQTVARSHTMAVVMKQLSLRVVFVAAGLASVAEPLALNARSTRVGEPLSTQPQATRPAGSSPTTIVGAWQLMSRTVRRSDGTSVVDPVLGEKPLGRLVYDASGLVMLQMMRIGRKEAIGTPSNERDRTNARVILGYDAYFGRYTVDARAGTVTHRVEGSLFPEDLGDDFVRPFTIAGDALTLQFTSPSDGLTRTLVFHRLR
jgi:hypothetical protein